MGRDPTTIELTAAVEAHLLWPGESKPENAAGVTGTPEEVAALLREFADVGVKHLIIAVSPEGVEGVERFSRVIELLDQG